MPESVHVRVNGKNIATLKGSTVAVAVMAAGESCRTSVTGQARGPLCGMGICFECRVTINGRPHCRSCQVVCEPDMEIVTNA